MTDGSGDWTYRGRFSADDFGAGDPRPDDDFYAELDRQGYGRPGPAERPGDPYQQPRSSDSGRYGQPGGYDGEMDGYGQPSGYGSPDGHGRYGQPPNDDGLADYGAGPDGQDPYGQDPYGQGPYGTGSPYPDAAHHPGGEFGRGGYEANGSFDRYGDDPYGGSPYGDSPYGDPDSFQPDPRTSAYERPGQRPAGDSPAMQQYGHAASAGGGNGYGDTGSFGRLGNGSYGETGSFGQADGGLYGDTGSFGRADSGSFGRGAIGSFGRGDSGSFGRPGNGSFDHDDTGRGQALPPSRGALPAGSDGYAQWQSDPTERTGWDDDRDHEDSGDDDWADDVDDGGPVSRFFGRGGRGGRGGAEHDDDGRGDRRPRRLRGRLAMVVAILAGALVLGMVTDFGYEYVHNWITNRYGDYSGAGYGTVHVTVPPGSTLTALGPTLLSDNVIMSLRPYDSAAGAASGASGLQPGVYVLHNHMSAASAVAALLNPKNRAKDQITIIEGSRASAIAAALAKQTGLPASQFTQIIDHPPASLGLPKWAPAGKSAEGFLFPDTYTLLPHESPLKILQTMVQDFNQRTASLRIAAIARSKSVTPYQMLIAASLIQAEGGSVSDFGKISRVIWNRIQQNIKLGFDSTVFYAMGKYGTAITKAEESYPSKYNTYKYFGLPPGPIESPGVAAIQAALHAPLGSELYFITDTRHKPYKTYFTSSFTQFQRWQLEFQG